ncbi:MAG: hypothetical protein ABIO94_00780, partial [Opitutaceae bacterium]
MLYSTSFRLIRFLPIALSFAPAVQVFAQSTPPIDPASIAAASAVPVIMSPFEVQSSQIQGYRV